MSIMTILPEYYERAFQTDPWCPKIRALNIVINVTVNFQEKGFLYFVLFD